MEKQKNQYQSLGKDELNLIEVPFTLLSDRQGSGQKTLEFTDRQSSLTRKWVITGSDKYGLPTALDEETYVAMMLLTKQAAFKNQKVNFNYLQMLKIMGWSTGGKHFDRLRTSLRRLLGVTIYTDYFWDRGAFQKPGNLPGDFHIIDGLSPFIRGQKSNWFKWSDVLYTSFRSGNLKTLDTSIYFSLKSAISKRLYRLCDKRFHKLSSITFDLQELCHEKLGFSRGMVCASELRRRLEPAIEEHKNRKLLSSVRYSRAKYGNTLVTLKRSNDPDIVSELAAIGVSKSIAEGLVKTYDHKLIETQLLALPYRSNLDNPPAFLVQAIKDNFPLPKKYLNTLSQKQSEAESELKSKYTQFLIQKVDDSLVPYDDRDLNAYMLKCGVDEALMNSAQWRDYYLLKFKLYKAKTLNLPDFATWKEQLQ